MVLLGCLVYLRWMRKNKQVLTWTSDLLIILHITIVLLVFDLLTSETRDYFGQLIMQKPADADMLANMQQLLLSGVWLFYSIILMGAGIWRRNFEIRVSAIVLSGITILKIFIYDLSFLNALNRIISFFALGLILLLLSYLYTRFKQIIFERIT
jgi:uncharacterized membrane protein